MGNPRPNDPEAKSRSRVVKVDIFSSKGREMDRTNDQIRLYDVPILTEIDTGDGRWLIQTEIEQTMGAGLGCRFAACKRYAIPS